MHVGRFARGQVCMWAGVHVGRTRVGLLHYSKMHVTGVGSVTESSCHYMYVHAVQVGGISHVQWYQDTPLCV